MPKITIKEYDNTKSNPGAYTNFTVVVPGLVADGQWTDEKGKKHNYGYDENDDPVFDIEGGIYECSSKVDFEKYIGRVTADSVVVVEAKAPTLIDWSTIENNSESDPDYNPRRLTEEAFDHIMEMTDTILLCSVTENTVGDYGLLRDENYIYTPSIGVEWNQNYFYALLDVKNVGVDGKSSAQYGNSMAYELLSLGYTVLYKKFAKNEATKLTEASFWEPLKDRATYDFRYIVNGLLSENKEANNAIIELANFNNKNPENSGRGDCCALVDLDADSYRGKSQAEALPLMKDALKEITASKYAAIFAPYVVYGNVKSIDHYGDNDVFPASFHYLACAARASETYNEWYAVAGYTRGISDYSIVETGIKLGEGAIDALEPREVKGEVDKAVNLVVKIRNNYYLWGNRTAEALEEEGDLKASHFLNIRQLCTTIKKQVYVSCRRFTFDPNSDVLWINFCNAIRPTLEKMKADQGIKDYKFIKVRTNQKATLKAKIRIVPIEAVEDFDISLYLEDSLGSVSVEEDEE